MEVIPYGYVSRNYLRAKEAGVSEAEANLQEVAKQRNFPVE